MVASPVLQAFKQALFTQFMWRLVFELVHKFIAFVGESLFVLCWFTPRGRTGALCLASLTFVLFFFSVFEQLSHSVGRAERLTYPKGGRCENMLGRHGAPEGEPRSGLC